MGRVVVKLLSSLKQDEAHRCIPDIRWRYRSYLSRIQDI